MPLVNETVALVDNGNQTFTLTVGAQGITLPQAYFTAINNGAMAWELILLQIFIQLVTAGVSLGSKAAVLAAINGMTVKVKE